MLAGPGVGSLVADAALDDDGRSSARTRGADGGRCTALGATGLCAGDGAALAAGTGGGAGAGAALFGCASRTASEPIGLPCLESSKGVARILGNQLHKNSACIKSDSANATQGVGTTMLSRGIIPP